MYIHRACRDNELLWGCKGGIPFEALTSCEKSTIPTGQELVKVCGRWREGGQTEGDARGAIVHEEE